MEYLEENIPEDIYQAIDFDADEMLKSNAELLNKIREITSVVKHCIQKAGDFKKSINTHRLVSKNPEVRNKRNKINQYQNALNTCKAYVDNLNIKIDNMNEKDRFSNLSNKLKSKNTEIKKFELHKEKLNEKLENQIQVIRKLYSEPEYEGMVDNITSQIKKTKETYDTMKQQRASMHNEQKVVLKEFTKVNAERRRLKNFKIALKNNVTPKKYYK